MSGRRDVVLVTPRSFALGDEALRQELSQAVGRVDWHQEGGLESEQLSQLVVGVEGWIAGVEPIDRAVIARADRLRVIARYGVGVDNVDVEAATERGIIITNTPGANAGAVAELVLGLLLSLARKIPQADRAVRMGHWTPARGVALEGKTVGLLGFGAIGQAVARRAVALGCRVLVYDPVWSAVATANELGVALVSQREVIAGADFVSLHLPLLPDTRGIVDAAFLAAMKPGAYLINAARGELVDEVALADALSGGRIGGAALDALSQEPPPPGFALGRLDNVVLTPHLGAHTDLAVQEMSRRAMDNCLAVLRGEVPANPVIPTSRSAR